MQCCQSAANERSKSVVQREDILYYAWSGSGSQGTARNNRVRRRYSRESTQVFQSYPRNEIQSLSPNNVFGGFAFSSGPHSK